VHITKLAIVASLTLLGAAACQDDSNDGSGGSGGGTPILPNVTSVGPGPGPGAGGGGGTTSAQGGGGNGTGTGGSGGNGTGSGGSGGSCGPAPGAGDFIINELHTSPSGTTDDVNCDSTTSTNDEFIEVVNATGGALDLTGTELHEGGVAKHTFSECLPAGQAIVIYNQGLTSMCGVGDWGTTIGASADTSFTLTNGGGEVISLELNAVTLDSVTTLNLASTNPRTSMTRSPDVTGSFAQHTTADTADASPFSVGTCLDGGLFPCN
jgi:hypothetical protein